MPETAYVALGSNVGDSMATLRSSLQQLAAVDGISLVACSGAWETTPVGPVSQGNYLNAAVSLHTGVAPRELLNILLDIERHHGRQRLVRWGPRTLDLDILLYGERRIDEPGLSIPHPWLRAAARDCPGVDTSGGWPTPRRQSRCLTATAAGACASRRRSGAGN
ncbi:MAG: 2-amino-4-hydroxy-6-hydroxymethyldihydropteridine diphosphokinase [bacterium]|nr:2-amino-4-hydroxy-6-hydroxymethyldihydropteridine diphosphokinase [bacterium]